MPGFARVICILTFHSGMRKAFQILLFPLCCVLQTLAQNEPDTLLAKDNVMFPLPTVCVNFGISDLRSDVALDAPGPSGFTQFGYQLTVSQRVAKYLNLSLGLYTGTVYGEEQRNTTNLNYRTSLFSQHLSVEYNFYPLLRPDERGRQFIRPYLGFGVGMLYFRSKGDLKDGNGIAYQYWTDGNIYAEPEGTVDATEATPLERDLVYETELRDADLDGLKKYPQTSFSIPFNAGIRFQLSKNVGLNAAFTYALNFSDMVDNVSTDGTGDREGNSGFDNHLYGSLGLTVFLGVTKPASEPQRFIDELAADQPSASGKDSEYQPGNNGTPDITDETGAEDRTEVTDEPGQKDEATPSGNLTRLAELSSDSHASSERTKASLSEITAMLNTATERAEQLRNKLRGSKKLTKTDRSALSDLVSMQKGIPEKLALIGSGISTGEEQATEPKTEYGTIMDARRQDLTESIRKLREKLRNGQQLLSDEQKKARSKEDAMLLLDRSDRLNRLGSEKMESIIVLQDAFAQAEKVELLSSRIEAVGEIVSEDRQLEEKQRSELEGHLTTIGKEVDMLASESNADRSTVQSLAVRFKEVSSLFSEQESETLTEAGEQTLKEDTTAMAEASGTGQVNRTEEHTDEAEAQKNGHGFSRNEIRKNPAKESGSFHWADVNRNGWISPDEVLHFIDLLFEGDSPRTVEDIQTLIDYYFDQE